MILKEAMTRPVVTIGINSTVRQAAQVMQEADIGFLPITNEGTCVGVLTDRDIVVRAVAPGLNLQQLSVAEVMSTGGYDRDVTELDVNSRIVALPEDTTIEEAVRLMEKCMIRRLAVCDDEKAIVGIVSASDLSKCTKTQQRT